jgi:hypothetical protein
MSTPSFSACCASHGVSWPSEMMKLPWLCIGESLIAQSGSLNEPVFVISRTSSAAAGTFMPVYSLRQFGSSFSSAAGSSTAPERECAPTDEAFSSTQMFVSGLSCFRRIAQARPAGPAPTITTSYSMTSRSVISAPSGSRRRGGCTRR